MYFKCCQRLCAIWANVQEIFSILISVVSDSTRAYEKAYESKPADEMIALNYFHCLVREHSYNQQQLVCKNASSLLIVKVASKIFKQFNRIKYYYWAVISIVSQVEAGASDRLLVLAQRMMEKMVQEGKLTEYERMYDIID